MSRVVTYAVLHEGVHIPAIGSIDKTLTNNAMGKTKDLKMTLEEDGTIKVVMKGVPFRLPLSSVSHFTLESDAPSRQVTN